MTEIIIIVACGTLAGLALGLTGGGGSNFAVPLLVYAVGLPPAQAMPVSLAAVALVAAVGAIQALRASLIAWPPTLTFAVGGMLGAPLGLRLAHGVEPQVLMTGFASLALTVGASMWYRARIHPEDAKVVRAMPEGDPLGPVCRLAQDGQLRFTAPCSATLGVAGLATGMLSGLFGVGGGFLIVPALLIITRISIHGAVATSLVVITLTGLSGATFAVLNGGIEWTVLMPFALGGACGMLLGRRIAFRIAGPVLQQVFSVVIVTVAIAMLIRDFL